MGFILFLLFVLLIVILAAWLVSIAKLIEVYKQKHKDGESASTGILWFIGIFASPMVLGLYVCALPDSSVGNTLQSQGNPVNQLPSV